MQWFNGSMQPLLQIDVKKPSRPPTFAFVEFDDGRDAAEACRGRDGYDFAGGRIRVRLVFEEAFE